MAVRPITAVSYTNGHNQVKFEGRRKNRRGEENYSNPVQQKLAVPLAATIIAMNSLVASAKPLDDVEITEPNKIEMVSGLNQSSERVVASKTFAKKYSAGLGHYTPQVKLINTKGGSGFDKIVYSLIMHDRNNYDNYLGEITGVNNSKFSIMSDDGSKGLTVSSKSLKIGDGTFSKELSVAPEEIQYVENAIKSTDNHGAAKMYNYNRGVRLTSRGLQNVPNGNILKDARPMSDLGKLCEKESINGDNGHYTLRVYAPDGRHENADYMTIQKDGFPEITVPGLHIDNATFNEGMANEQKLTYGTIMLLADDPDGRRKLYYIQDDTLTQKIIDFLEKDTSKSILNSLELREQNSKYIIQEDMIVPISQ